MKKLTEMSEITLPLLVGWHEWFALPQLGIKAIKAKIDTGAKTSSLHAFNIEEFKKGRQRWVKFDIHPLQNNDAFSIPCTARVIDERIVTSSSGQGEMRYVIKATLDLHHKIKWDIELTLTNRDTMAFRMLLGREAMHHRVIVDPAHSCLLGRLSNRQVQKRYKLIV
jgi:ribosomal protein S6--L-glutamate ligase